MPCFVLSGAPLTLRITTFLTNLRENEVGLGEHNEKVHKPCPIEDGLQPLSVFLCHIFFGMSADYDDSSKLFGNSHCPSSCTSQAFSVVTLFAQAV